MLQFQMPNITREQLATNRTRFEVEPLDRGFGHTFGNSLRRVLLSSLEGAAVSSVKVEGVSHEFSTLPALKEDVTDVILNLKGIICRLHGDLDEVQVRLIKGSRARSWQPTSTFPPSSRSSTRITRSPRWPTAARSR